MIRSVFRWARSLVVLVPFVLACSSSSQKDPEVPDNGAGSGVEGSGDSSAGSGEESPSKPSSGTPAGPGAGELTDAKKEWMEAILKRGAGKAANCSASVPDGKGGEGEVKILFDGQKGKVTEVTVGTPWAGTSMEACIKRAWVGEYVMTFEGDPLEVPYTIKIPEKAGAAADPKKPGGKK